MTNQAEQKLISEIRDAIDRYRANGDLLLIGEIDYLERLLASLTAQKPD